MVINCLLALSNCPLPPGSHRERECQTHRLRLHASWAYAVCLFVIDCDIRFGNDLSFCILDKFYPWLDIVCGHVTGYCHTKGMTGLFGRV